MVLLHMILKTASPSMYNVEECSFRQMQEMQRVIQMTVVPALPCNQIHENSHIHITPRLPPPAGKQPLNYSISALVVGPPGHLATILSVISLTDEWPYCSHRGAVFRKQSFHNRNTSAAVVYPPIPTLLSTSTSVRPRES